MVQWLRVYLPVQGMRLQSLVRELRSRMSQGQTNTALKKEAIFVTKFNKSSKNGPHQKKSIIWGKNKDKNLFYMSFYDHFLFAEMAFQSNQLAKEANRPLL